MSSASCCLIEGFESIAEKYDGFILDQYGVMHNGEVALPGAKVIDDHCHDDNKVTN